MRLQTFYANLVLRSKEPLRICFDLDGTLFTDPLKPGDFTTVKPLPDNIGICRQLKEQGHTIIINTGRAMGTHNGAVQLWSQPPGILLTTSVVPGDQETSEWFSRTSPRSRSINWKSLGFLTTRYTLVNPTPTSISMGSLSTRPQSLRRRSVRFNVRAVVANATVDTNGSLCHSECCQGTGSTRKIPGTRAHTT